ncbi:MAG TPA: phage baseplate assembly protein V, partial [Planctomycetota bacterium]|nr:phage baseplate assembly protein V [Planctomycetota bacterium]
MTPIESLPRLRVDLAGAPLSPADEAKVAEVRVRRRLSLPAQAEIVFEGTPEGCVQPGASVRIGVGDDDLPLFAGEVTALEQAFLPTGGALVRVRAYDALHRLRKRRPMRVHVQVDPAGLARELASDLGVSVVADAAGPVQERRAQAGPSDLDLLRSTTRDCGLYFDLREDVLRLFPLGGSGESVALARGLTLLDATAEQNLDPSCRSVTAVGWDPARAEVYRGTAAEPRAARAPGDATDPARLGEQGTRTCAGRALQDAAQAEALAQAALDVEVARELTLRGRAAGDPRLRPGTAVEVSGLAPGVDGRFVLTKVDHVIDARQGYVVEFSTEPPDPPAPGAGAGVAMGVVAEVDDPDGLGRVRVTLPGLCDLDAGWAPVMVPGAGSGKGCIALPDVNDRVLVLLPDG